MCSSLKLLGIETPYDPAIPVWDTLPKAFLFYYKETCSASSLATQMTLVKVNGSQNKSVSPECKEGTGRNEGSLMGMRGRMWGRRVIKKII